MNFSRTFSLAYLKNKNMGKILHFLDYIII